VGVYVDDIIYFRSSDDVERKFEESLGQLVSVDFMGQVSHFLGIEFPGNTMMMDISLSILHNNRSPKLLLILWVLVP
jgi:hypothetical protein